MRKIAQGTTPKRGQDAMGTAIRKEVPGNQLPIQAALAQNRCRDSTRPDWSSPPRARLPMYIYHLLLSHPIFISSQLILSKEETPPFFSHRRCDRPFNAIRVKLHCRRRTRGTATRSSSRARPSRVTGASSSRGSAKADGTRLLPPTICTDAPPHKNKEGETSERSADPNDGDSASIAGVG